MSIVNAFVNPDCGVVCADTEAGQDGGPYIEVSKLVPLPHMNAIIAFRGSVLFLSGALTGVFVSGCDFDELSGQMPDILKLASDKAVELCSRFVHTASMTREEAGCGEAIIVGFSPAMSRVVGHHFTRKTLDHGFVETNNIRYFSAPAWDGINLNLQDIHTQPSKENMKSLALSQLCLMREREKDGLATGGRLIFAEVRQSGMTIESVLDFPTRSTGNSVVEQRPG